MAACGGTFSVAFGQDGGYVETSGHLQKLCDIAGDLLGSGCEPPGVVGAMDHSDVGVG